MGLFNRSVYRKEEIMLVPSILTTAVKKNYIECPTCGINRKGYTFPHGRKATSKGIEVHCNQCKKNFYVDVDLSEQYRKNYFKHKKNVPGPKSSYQNSGISRSGISNIKHK